MSNPRALSRISEIIIHCAATPNGQWFTAKDIDAWHKQRGFNRSPALAQYSPLKHIGYHFVIGLKGGVVIGRRLDETGAHCVGHNTQSIGICLIGTDRFTQAQWQALKTLVEVMQDKFPGIRILGHRDTSPDLNGDGVIRPNEWVKTCPGFSVTDWLAGDKRAPIDHCLME